MLLLDTDLILFFLIVTITFKLPYLFARQFHQFYPWLMAMCYAMVAVTPPGTARHTQHLTRPYGLQVCLLLIQLVTGKWGGRGARQ